MSASVLVAQCLYRDTPGPAHLSFARMAAHAAAAGVAVELEAAQDARIDVARNVLAAEALRRGAGHILYVDDDVVLPPDALVRLLARDVPVVSGVYYRRRPPFEPFAGYFDADTFDLAPTSCVATVEPGLQRVGWVGAGCLLIRCDVLWQMHQHFGDCAWFLSSPAEDVFFCHRLAEMGVPVYLDGDVQCGHVSQTIVTGEHFRHAAAEVAA